VQTLRRAGERLRAGAGAADAELAAADAAAETPPARPRSPMGDVARGAAATAAQSEEQSPGMAATPRRPDDPES
jgi:hypothetical protein